MLHPCSILDIKPEQNFHLEAACITFGFLLHKYIQQLTTVPLLPWNIFGLSIA